MKLHFPAVLVVLVLVGLTPAQTTTKLAPAPSGFDVRRDNIERGKVETVEYDSKSAGGKRKMTLYTPPGNVREGARLPVFYLLHGAGDNETGWQKKGAADTILDNLYADKKLAPMYVVMPYGYVLQGDKKNPAAFDDDLIKDLIPFVDATYPVFTDREHRAVAGLSMGGGQALRIGLKNLDKFAYVGGFSSAIGKAGNLIPDTDAAKKLRLLWVSCGDKDTLLKSNEAFHTSLTEKNVPHLWHLESGAHTWPVWRNDLYLISQKLFHDDGAKKKGTP